MRSCGIIKLNHLVTKLVTVFLVAGFTCLYCDANNLTETVLMARIDDLGDKLRLGMNKLQAAVGETARGGGGELSISLEEAEALRQEEMEGVRERFSKTVAELNDQVRHSTFKCDHDYNQIYQESKKKL